jgi:MerR family mercuric resistance operon transcriptional regulator
MTSLHYCHSVAISQSQILKLEDDTHCGEAAEVAAQRLADTRARPADLKRMEVPLSQLVCTCHA